MDSQEEITNKIKYNSDCIRKIANENYRLCSTKGIELDIIDDSAKEILKLIKMLKPDTKPQKS